MAGAEVRFYHLTRWPLETALPRLLTQAYAREIPTLVRVGSDARLAALNAALWTYEAGSFLPHGGPGDGDAADQPIYLTTDTEVPNQAELLVLVDGAEADDIDQFARCFEVFDDEPEHVAAARQRWTHHTEAGRDVTYWQQTPEGRWEQKA